MAHGPKSWRRPNTPSSQGRDEVLFLGIDYPEDARRAIQEGTLLATINQDPGAHDEDRRRNRRQGSQGRDSREG